jgi:hypothetical protein
MPINGFDYDDKARKNRNLQSLLAKWIKQKVLP